MSSITPTIRKQYIRKDGTSQVYLNVYVSRKLVRINTNVYVSSKNWNEKKNCVLGSDADHQDKNLQINNCIARVSEIQKKYRLLFKEITPQQLIDEYRIFSTNIDFHEFVLKEINVKRKTSAYNTTKKHLSSAKKLREFRPNLSFSEINESFIKQYDTWLRISKKNATNTRMKELAFLKEYIRIALHAGKIESSPFQFYKLKSEKTDIIYLTKEDLHLLLNIYRNKQLPYFQDLCLRKFLFMCFTGMRISDVENLTWANIDGNNIVFIAHKTRNQKTVQIVVPLVDVSKEIIESESGDKKYGFIFRKIERNTISRNIKQICKDVGILKNVSTKTGRHTFATLFLESGGALEVLQKILGHSNIRETMIYAHVSNSRIENQMSKFALSF